MRRFAEEFTPASTTRILDVGGATATWRLAPTASEMTLLNLSYPQGVTQHAPGTTLMRGDGTRLPFSDGSFDVAYSNSVLEHLFTLEQQGCFAEEVRRVAGSLWIQTPAREFLIEPHYLAPLIHFLPKPWRRRLLRNFTPFGLMTRPSQERVDELVDEIRLVTFEEMQELFPDCEIRRERILFLTKSYIAVRHGPAAAQSTTDETREAVLAGVS